MERRFAIFWALAFLLIIINFTLQAVFFPQQRPAQVAQRDGDKAKAGDKLKGPDKSKRDDGPKEADGAKADDKAAKPKAGKDAGEAQPHADKEPALGEKGPAVADKPAAEEPALPEVVDFSAVGHLGLGRPDPAIPHAGDAHEFGRRDRARRVE